jgi:oligosaccharide repeat unit polymerase
LKIGVYFFIVWAAIAAIIIPSIYSFVSLLLITTYLSPFFLTFSYDRISAFQRTYNSIGFKLLFLLLATGVSNLLIITNNAGHSLDALLTIEGFSNIAISSTVKRYSDDVANSGSPLLLAFNLFGTYRVGLSYLNELKYKILLVFSPIIFYTLLTTEKFPLFLATVFFLLGIVSNYKRSEKKESGFFFSILVLTIFPLMGAFFAFRNRGYDTQFFDFINLIKNYLFVQYHNFGYWFINNSLSDCCTYGHLTFVGPLNYLGVFDRWATSFSDSVVNEGYASNIYTAWRYLVQDFSFAGPFIINFFLALIFIIVSKFNLYRIKEILRNFIIFVSMIGINTTFFTHNSVYFAFFLCMFYRIFIYSANNDESVKQPNES